MSASAVAVGSVMSCGVRTTSRPSLLGSLRKTSRVSAYRSGGASPRTSTGLAWLQGAGRKPFSFSIASGESSESSPPPVMSASVARTPGPPAVVTRRGLGRLAAAGWEGVGGGNAGAAGVGDNGEARTLGSRLLAQSLGHVEEIGDVIDPYDPAPAKGGVQDLIATGQGPGVRGGSIGGCLRTTGSDSYDRPGQGSLAESARGGSD